MMADQCGMHSELLTQVLNCVCQCVVAARDGAITVIVGRRLNDVVHDDHVLRPMTSS